MKIQNADPTDFLGSCDVIDVNSETVQQAAKRLANPSSLATTKTCFEFVRDEIRHSSDYQLNPVTCRASDVLKHRTGYCYAKSHLLCALLRANHIPAGLCYQRLSIDGANEPFCLHGLNAVYVSGTGWYRIDARGNRDDVDAQFCPPEEKLAFEIKIAGEKDIPGIHAEPLPSVVACLQTHKTWDDVLNNLPDASDPR